MTVFCYLGHTIKKSVSENKVECNTNDHPLLYQVTRKKRKKWTSEQMTAAMESVEKRLSGVKQAALQQGVPKITLENRLLVGFVEL